MLCVIMPFCLGQRIMWEGEWITFGSSPVTADDVEVWPFSVDLLVKLVTFLGTLHWPAGADLGVVAFHLLECSFCISCGLVKCSCLGKGRFSVSGTPNFSVGCSVWSRHRQVGCIRVVESVLTRTGKELAEAVGGMRRPTSRGCA